MMLSVSLLVIVCVSAAHGCCYPDKWQGTEGFISGSSDDEGHGALTTGNAYIAMDATQEAIYIDENLQVNGQNKEYKILQLFQTNTQYIITGGKCTRTVTGKWTNDSHCIPALATPKRQYYFGSQQQLNVHEYLLNVKQQTFEIGVSDDCVPVIERNYGNLDGTNVLTITGFFNITPGIPDPSVFTVPAICNSAQQATVQTMYRRRRSIFTGMH